MNTLLAVIVCGATTMMVVGMTQAGGHGETTEGSSGWEQSPPIGNDSVIPQGCNRCHHPCSNYQCCAASHPRCCNDGRHCYCCS